MKFVILCLFITLLTQICQKTCMAHRADVEAALKECQALHDINDSQLAEIEQRTKEPSEVDMNLKCFAHCFMKNMEFLNEDGKLDDEKFLESQIMPNAQADLINDCKAMHDLIEDPCEYVFELFHCLKA